MPSYCNSPNCYPREVCTRVCKYLHVPASFGVYCVLSSIRGSGYCHPVGAQRLIRTIDIDVESWWPLPRWWTRCGLPPQITYTIAKTYQPPKPGSVLSFQNAALGSVGESLNAFSLVYSDADQSVCHPAATSSHRGHGGVVQYRTNVLWFSFHFAFLYWTNNNNTWTKYIWYNACRKLHDVLRHHSVTRWSVWMFMTQKKIQIY